jgi:hypothetical protein
VKENCDLDIDLSNLLLTAGKLTSDEFRKNIIILSSSKIGFDKCSWPDVLVGKI